MLHNNCFDCFRTTVSEFYIPDLCMSFKLYMVIFENSQQIILKYFLK